MTTDVAPMRDWKRVRWTRAGQLTAMLDGAVDLQPLYDVPPASAFSALRAQDPSQAARFIAQCLPRLDAVQWAAACLQHDHDRSLPGRGKAFLAIRQWIADPSDAARRHAFAAGDLAGWDSPEGATCLAIFLSGGSIAPAEQAVPVNPSPGGFGQALAAAVLMAAQARGPAAAAARLSGMLDLADAMAAGQAPEGRPGA